MSGRVRQNGRARRRPDLSQHFIKSAETARKLVDLASIGPSDLVVEAGAGKGALTAHLADAASHVIAVESDRSLFMQLKTRFKRTQNLTVRHADFLTYSLPAGPYTFFANIPFARTADIVRKITLGPGRLQDAFLIMEAAAAARFLGQPFGPESALSIMIKARFQPSIIAWLSLKSFDPPPAVNSVLVRFACRTPSLFNRSSLAGFDHFARSTFASSRPFTGRSLRGQLNRVQGQSLRSELGFPATAPPSTIPFDQWVTVFNLTEWNRKQ